MHLKVGESTLGRISASNASSKEGAPPRRGKRDAEIPVEMWVREHTRLALGLVCCV